MSSARGWDVDIVRSLRGRLEGGPETARYLFAGEARGRSMNFAQFSMVCRVFFSLRAEMEGGAVEGASLVASLASESAHSFPRISECPGVTTCPEAAYG